MKNIRWKIIIALLTNVLFYSCCTKQSCVGVDSISSIDFYGFNANELDTITLKKFIKNSNFASIIDSINFFGASSGNSFPSDISSNYPDSLKHYIFMQQNIDVGFEYVVFISSNHKTYKIGNFLTEEATCGKGICKNAFTTLKNYEVNGIKQNGLEIYLIK